jgi:hypothetical protein
VTHEELESYRDRFDNIMQGKDEDVKNRRLIALRMDLQETYNIPPVLHWFRFNQNNPEVAKLYREVVEAIPN